MHFKDFFAGFFCFIAALGLVACAGPAKTTLGVAESPKLAEHSKEFEKKIYKVADGVYSAVGYGIANSILLVGADGVVVVDTMATVEEGRAVWNDFRKLTGLPLAAIVYTHFHPDHIYGAAAFAGTASIDVYAHETTDSAVRRFTSETAPIIGARSMGMYGILLSQAEVINVGIGPLLDFGPSATLGYIPPTKTFRDRLAVTVAGIRMELIHAPGETDDQIYVWLPDRKILLCGDNIYKSFPNLYTIRGTWFRSLKSWYQSVDIVRDLAPEILVPSHGRPVGCAAAIDRIATDYRDAIQFVHDQSLRAMNRGMTPLELAESVKLPAHLAASPYLQEFYGKASWSARSMFAGNLGWFSGDAADLHPLPPAEQARMTAEIAGGETKLLEHARRYLDAGKHQAALQLSGELIRLNPANGEARSIRVRALTALGEREYNAPARHYYLTEALEIRDNFVARPPMKPDAQMVRKMPLSVFFDALAARLDPISSASLDRRAGMRFTDTNETYTIHIRRGVAEITSRLKGEPDILVLADSVKWKEMLARLRSPVVTLAGFDYPKGNMLEFAAFLKHFDAPPMQLPVENKR